MSSAFWWVRGSDVIRVNLSLQFPALAVAVEAMLSADPEIVVLADENKAADVHILTPAAFSRRAGLSSTNGPALGGVLVLGVEGLDLQHLWSLSAAWGVLPVDVAPERLCAAVRAVAAGLVVGDARLLENAAGIVKNHGPLTEREVQVLGLLSTGLANKQVAAQLGISEHTVKFHVSSIYTKLNVGNRAEAVREGLRGGWIAL